MTVKQTFRLDLIVQDVGLLKEKPRKGVPLVTSRRERPTHIDFVELAEVHGLEAVDGRPDVLAVRALLHHLQLANTGHVGQPGLDLGHVWYLGMTRG